MLSFLAKKLFGSSNDRVVKKLFKEVEEIGKLEEGFAKLSDAKLKEKSAEFKKRVEKGESLASILNESFALVREASKRVLKMRHFDVQIFGGIVLHKGMIAEMKTGEGKTLVASLPAYLNALTGKGVHIVTVNDYLAERDANWIGKLYEFLGLSVGCVLGNMDEQERIQQYMADITYGTNNEFGFDYLRDNLKLKKEEMVQRPFNYVIVDEVDSILIDEARTPLIISGPAEDHSLLYNIINKIVPQLALDCFEINEKENSALLTELGQATVEDILKKLKVIDSDSKLYDVENMKILHHLDQAVKAHKLFKQDTHYIVNEGKVMIIDEFTGRIMDGRRYSEGLHQAIEAKENVEIQKENQTLASVTFQNYFKLYPKISGMTGTAITEADEFSDIYGLDVISIPTNVPVKRLDSDDLIYRTKEEKLEAILNKIETVHKLGRPILVGTISVESSEEISKLLKKRKIKHNVLNAKQHKKEALVIANAGRLAAVTIATNMAGRGTDIKLGGNLELLLKDKVIKNPHKDVRKFEKELINQLKEEGKKARELGGLLVLSTERHEARRIDNQLRGRSGRQGDPGESIFYISLEDDLMRLFGSEKLSTWFKKLGMKQGESIEHPLVSKAVANAQQKIENRNYDVRKNLLKFDNIMNEQRNVIYAERRNIMELKDPLVLIKTLSKEEFKSMIQQYLLDKGVAEKWDVEVFAAKLHKLYNTDFSVKKFLKEEESNADNVLEYLVSSLDKLLKIKLKNVDESLYTQLYRQIMIITLDDLWKDHLHALDHLRHGINLRAFAQKDPINEYKKEAFILFKELLDDITSLILERVMKVNLTNIVNIANEDEGEGYIESRSDVNISSDQASGSLQILKKVPKSERDPRKPSSWGKVSRNEACPCHSGKKYKHCHGKV